MAEYEYKCLKCGNLFILHEAIALHEAEHVACPQCKNHAVERIYTKVYAKTAKKS